MTDTKEALEARTALLEKWGEVMSDLVQQFIDQCNEKGQNPEWFYPRKIVEGRGTIRIHWSLRPDIEAALTAMDAGGSAEEAAKIGADFSRKSLDQLIMDDTLWEQEG